MKEKELIELLKEYDLIVEFYFKLENLKLPQHQDIIMALNQRYWEIREKIKKL